MEENNYNLRPNNYLVWAILTTILCCLPFGIVSIVYSSKVNNYWDAGMQREAQEAANKAKNWAIASAITGSIIYVLYILLVIFGTISLAALGMGI